MKTRKNPQEGISGNCKYQKISELAPNGINSKVQQGNSNRDPSWHQKELIPRCQQEHFAPTDFEIQIWVFNFGRGVEYSKIWINGFPFAQITFLLSRQSGKKTDVCYDSKNPPSHPCINSLIFLNTNSLICCIHYFYPWSQFSWIPDYLVGKGRF